MKTDDETMEILSELYDDLSEVSTISYYDYTHASSKRVSKLLDDYHMTWIHTDPGNLYLIPKK
jgi:hypothetical protein